MSFWWVHQPLGGSCAHALTPSETFVASPYTSVLGVFGTCGILMSSLLDQSTEAIRRVAHRSQYTPYGLMGCCFTNALIYWVLRLRARISDFNPPPRSADAKYHMYRLLHLESRFAPSRRAVPDEPFVNLMLRQRLDRDVLSLSFSKCGGTEMFWCMDSARAADALVVLTKSAKKKRSQSLPRRRAGPHGERRCPRTQDSLL